MELEIFSTDFQKKKNPQIRNFVEILPVEAEFFHADGRTDGHDEAKKSSLLFWMSI
jgi:hypothetical protein